VRNIEIQNSRARRANRAERAQGRRNYFLSRVRRLHFDGSNMGQEALPANNLEEDQNQVNTENFHNFDLEGAEDALGNADFNINDLCLINTAEQVNAPGRLTANSIHNQR
jgi:hypothetical protein